MKIFLFNKNLKKIVLLILLILPLYAISQNDYQLATQYYASGEYEKAAAIYERLFNESGAKFYFDNYIKSLIELKDYDEAEKKINKQIKKSPNELTYYVDLGSIYGVKKEEDKKLEKYNYVISNLGVDKNIILTVASSFITKQEYDWAEKTYNQAVINTKDSYHPQLAALYATQMKKELMIKEYIQYVIETPSQIENVKTTFEYFINNDTNDEFSNLLKKNLLISLQEKSNSQLTEILIWYYLQKLDYYSAYIQSKALDIRNKEAGYRVYSIAQTAFNNGDYQTANEAYQYVIDKGNLYSYYNKSRYGLLTVLYQQVIDNQIKTNEEIANLENSYLTLINDMGVVATTIDVIKDLAHIQAFYLNKPTDAIILLQKAIEVSNLSFEQKGKCQIELGDILMLTGDVWGATLTYAQAETTNIGNDIGDLAKFKKAKIYYYTGNFIWAEGQLDVLKASTSKFISNDALDLAKLISESIAEDSLGLALQNYSRAELLFEQNKDSLAILTVDSVIANFKTSQILDNCYFLKYKIYISNNDYDKAVTNLQTIVDTYSWGDVADKALYLYAQITENHYNDKVKAMELYKKLMLTYTGSLYVVEARERFRILRGDFVE